MQSVATGQVAVNGQDVRRVTQRSLRAAIGMVPQEPDQGSWSN